jgi:hypothetical protein
MKSSSMAIAFSPMQVAAQRYLGFFCEQFDGCKLRRSWYALPNSSPPWRLTCIFAARIVLGMSVAGESA